MEMQLLQQMYENDKLLHMKAVDYKGLLGCIEILKAKAAIMFDRFYMNKAQQEVESQRKRGRKRQQWKNKLQYIIACYFTVRLIR